MITFSDPRKNVERFGINDGMHIADFGSGAGHYTTAAAERVGDSGRVYAIDVQRDLLKKVKDLSEEEHRNNVEVIWGNIEKPHGSKLHDKSVDAVILANTLFQVEDKDTVLQETLRVLKPKGQLFVSDWTESYGGIGPQPDEVVEESKARALCEKNGFVYERSVEVGLHHYGLIFRVK